MLRLLLIGGLLYGAWIGVDGLLVNGTAPGEPEVVDIALLEERGPDPGRWVRVVGATAHPAFVRRFVEDGSGRRTVRYLLLPFLSTSVYWEHYDELGSLRDGIAVEEAPRVPVVARFDPGRYDPDSLVLLEQATLQGVATRVESGLSREQRSLLREKEVLVADGALVLDLGEEPRVWWLNLLIVVGALGGAGAIVTTFAD